MRSRKKSRLKRRREKLSFYGDRCYLCGKPLTVNSQKLDRGFTLDHVIAQAKGGESKKINLKECCKKCNERKAAMDIIILKKGTIIKVDGLPFELIEDTKAFGEEANLDLVRNNDRETDLGANVNP